VSAITSVELKLSYEGRDWFRATLDKAIDDAIIEQKHLERQLTRYPSGFIRKSLLPQLEAQKAFVVWLEDQRLALNGET
jgi:hypothetical protein